MFLCIEITTVILCLTICKYECKIKKKGKATQKTYNGYIGTKLKTMQKEVDENAIVGNT